MWVPGTHWRLVWVWILVDSFVCVWCLTSMLSFRQSVLPGCWAQKCVLVSAPNVCLILIQSHSGLFLTPNTLEAWKEDTVGFLCEKPSFQRLWATPHAPCFDGVLSLKQGTCPPVFSMWGDCWRGAGTSILSFLIYSIRGFSPTTLCD